MDYRTRKCLFLALIIFYFYLLRVKVMSMINRRAAIAGVLVGTSAILPTGVSESSANEPNRQAQDENQDREFVIKAGMTEKEADCWEKVAQAAGAFFALPELHSMDDHEVASAIHVIQHKLLARPTYRKYLELAKAAHQKNKD